MVRLPHSFIVGVVSLVTVGCVPQYQPPPSPEVVQMSAQYVGKGVIALRAGKLEEAQAAFLLAEETYPSAQAVDGLGCVEFRRRRYDKAQQLFEQAIERDPGYSMAYSNLALLHEVKGAKARARELYQLSLEKDPHNFKARNNYAASLDRQSFEAVARQELLKARTVREDKLIEENLRELDSNSAPRNTLNFKATSY